MKLVDAGDSKSPEVKLVPVRFRPPAPKRFFAPVAQKWRAPRPLRDCIQLCMADIRKTGLFREIKSQIIRRTTFAFCRHFSHGNRVRPRRLRCLPCLSRWPCGGLRCPVLRFSVAAAGGYGSVYGGYYGGNPQSYHRPPSSYRYFYGDQSYRPYHDGARNHTGLRTRSNATAAAPPRTRRPAEGRGRTVTEIERAISIQQ